MGDEEFTKARARSLLAQVDTLPSHKLTPSARGRFLKLLRSELRFLDRITGSPLAPSALNSTNLGYLEAIVRVLHHPSVDAVASVFHSFSLSPSEQIAAISSIRDEVHVDIVCTFQAKPIWVVVSDRNPNYLNWIDECEGVRGWKFRVEALVNAAARVLDMLQPVAVLFCFAKGVSSSVARGFEADFGASRIEVFGLHDDNSSHGASEGSVVLGDLDEVHCDLEDDDWVYVRLSKEHTITKMSAQKMAMGMHHRNWVTLMINVDGDPWLNDMRQCSHPMVEPSSAARRAALRLRNLNENSGSLQENKHANQSLDEFEFVTGEARGSFASFLEILLFHKEGSQENDALNLVNLDTTALVALVSEASNGAACMVATMCSEDLVSRFGNTAQFMKDQAEDELKSPLLEEMKSIMNDRKPFISGTVFHEFKSLVSLCGGTKEKQRAEELFKLLPVFADTPSARVMSLNETGKIKEKNKIIFGTGDCWHAPTLTANLSFVRAVQQIGMALSAIEHQPRALVGDKCN